MSRGKVLTHGLELEECQCMSRSMRNSRNYRLGTGREGVFRKAI